MMFRKEYRKALALAIYAKSVCRSSTIVVFTYKKLSQMTGLSFSTLKKRLKTLEAFDMVERIGINDKHLLFKNIRAKRSNVDLSKLDLSSIKSIELGLYALYLMEVQIRKDYVKHLIYTAHNGKDNDKVKSAQRKCRKYGYGTQFNDYGISYGYLCRKLHISRTTASKLIKHSEDRRMLVKYNNNVLVYKAYNQRDAIRYAYDRGLSEIKSIYIGKKNVWRLYANTYKVFDEAMLIDENNIDFSLLDY